ncbi:hypothetical protein KJ973_02355 [Patescibacteria group bacterium]|nr:hypothetical protein [Patescibacteria group bacterium]MBU1730007.1 hypothetical protein [Patescibacteria group bacterium]MBU2010194.1 hypothetical protein [Patescibacteria group bacterium]MBU2460634.1 hypothetical protein [Patescibacteria group bacterium]
MQILVNLVLILLFLYHPNDGAWVKSISHEAIISKEIYDKVKQALDSRRKSKHYNNKLIISYRGIFTCGICGRIYTPYNRKNHIYLGARCDKSCPNKKRMSQYGFWKIKSVNNL